MRAADAGDALAALLERLHLSPSRLAVGLSGGPDSLALLYALAGDERFGSRLVAWHVHHGLQRAADDWEALSRQHCAHLGIRCDTFRVSVTEIGGGPEAAARDARYRAFASALAAGEVLLLAHHADDQAETLLLNALRGSGTRGLAAMPAARGLGAGHVLRPLLGFRRAALAALLPPAAAAVASDPQNEDTRFDRVYIRRAVLPALAERWPDAAAQLATAASHVRVERSAAEHLGRARLARAGGIDGSLPVRALRHLEPVAQRELLLAWLRADGYGAPPARRVTAFIAALTSPRNDHAAELRWDDSFVRHYDGRLYKSRALPEPVTGTLVPGARLALGPGFGWLELIPTDGPGIRLASGGLTIGPRRGGELFADRAGSARRPVKDLLREARVLPWWRAHLPLAFDADRLVAIADLWQETDRNIARCYRLCWHQAPRIAAR